MSYLVAIFVPIGAFITAAFIVYVVMKARKQERIALIESDRDASVFFGNYKARLLNNLKTGMVLVGIGIGFLFAEILEISGFLYAPFSFLTVTPICAGLALILFYNLKKDDILD